MTRASVPPVLSPSASGEAFDVLPIATLLLRRLPFVSRFVGVTFILGLAHAFLAPKHYTATSSFIVAQTQGLSTFGGLGALANRLGTSLPPSLAGDNAPRLLQAALSSGDVLDAVLDTGLAVMGRPDTIHLLNWYEVRGESQGERLENGRKALKTHINVTLNDRSGIVTLDVDDRDPSVAATIATALVGVVNDFNLRTQQTTSRATRLFLERRLGEVQSQLASAEDELRVFLQRNRQVAASPTLQMEQARMQRRIDIQQQVYVGLAQELEQARSNEVRDTPVLTIIEHAVPPVKRSWPKRKLILAVWMIVGLATSIAWVGVSNVIAQSSGVDSPAWRDFRTEVARIRIWNTSRSHR